MEEHAQSHGLSAADREKYATVVRTSGTRKTYKFPIPPRGHPGAESHARAALAYIDRSDLTPAEKDHVRASAHKVLNGFYESDAGAPKQPEQESPPMSPEPTPIAENTAPPPAQPADLATRLATLQAERDLATAELRKISEALSPDPARPAPSTGEQAVALLEQIKRERDVERSSAQLEATLRESALPDPVKARLARRYAGRSFELATLEADIAEERDVLGKLTDSGLVRGHSYEKPLTLGMSEYEQLQAAFDQMFDICESEAAKSVPRISGIREAFRIATGTDISSIGGADRPLREAYATGLRNYVASRGGHLQESELILREADVTTASFSYLLATSMNKRLLKDYQAWPSEWMKFASVVSVKDFKQQDRVRLGAFGSLSTVAEDAAYTTLTLSDTRAIYTPTKRGNLVQISRETIINDDLYAIKQIPQKLAVSAAFTLAEFVYEFFDPNGGNIYDGFKLFDTTNHKNTGIATASLGTANSGTAFSTAGMQAGVIAMRKQQNMASKPIGLKPRFVLVPPDLEFTAMTILKSAGLPGGQNNDINPMMGYAEPIVSPQCNGFTTGPTSTTSFCALIADPRTIDTIEIGFVGGQVNPVLFIQDQPLYGLNFSQDVISYKVRHEYGGAVVDYRGFYLINN